MNILTIFYEERDTGKFFELMRIMHKSRIKQDWNNAESTFKIIWDWSQKKEVVNLLSFLKETFLNAKIRIEHDVEESRKTPSSEPNSMKIEEVEKEDIAISSKEKKKNEEINSDVSTEIPTEPEMIPENEAEESCDDDVEERLEESSEEDSYVTDSTKVTCDDVGDDTKDDTKTPKEEIDDAAEESTKNTDADVIEEDSISEGEETFEEISHESSTPEVLESPSETSVAEPTLVASESQEEPESQYEEDLEEVLLADPVEELKNVLAPHLAKYNFDEKFNEATEKFALDQGIKSEAFVKFFALSNSAPNLEVLYAGVARIVRKNVALVRIDCKKSFEKWLKSVAPEIYEKCPDVNVVHFLNIFRRDDEKF